MGRGFRELEGVTADLGLEAWGRDLTEAVGQAALGLASLLADPQSLRPAAARRVGAEGTDLGAAVVGLLNEIIYLADTEDFLPCRVEGVEVRGSALSATLLGEVFDPARHVRRHAVKAATYHGLSVRGGADEVRIRVILDV